MSRRAEGRDIGPDEDRPGDQTYPHSHWPRSQVGAPITSPSDDIHQASHRQFQRLPDGDLEEDTADPDLHPRINYGIRGRPGLAIWNIGDEPMDTSPATEAEVYNSVFPPGQRPQATSDYYKSEEKRLETFVDWPFTSAVRREDLARNGFIYTGSTDKVRCVYCNTVLRQWAPGDVVESEHQRISPSCRFVCGEDVGNIPFNPALNVLRSQTVQMSSFNHHPAQQQQQRGLDIDPDEDRCGARQSSPFPHQAVNGWASQQNGLLQRSVTARSRNIVQQSMVNGEHHALSSRPRNQAMAAEPDRLQTFESWPAQIRQRPEQLAEAGLYYIGDSDKVKCFHCDVQLHNWEPNDDPWVEHARWFPQCQYVRLAKGDQFVRDVKEGRAHTALLMETPAVLAVLSEGHSVEKVQAAIKVLKEKEGAGVLLTAPKLLGTVLDLDRRPTPLGHSHSDSAMASADVEELQRENENLREKQQCKICMERDVEVIFYPCKHFVCCAMCGSAITSCPICRNPIQSRDKVYMA